MMKVDGKGKKEIKGAVEERADGGVNELGNEGWRN